MATVPHLAAPIPGAAQAHPAVVPPFASVATVGASRSVTFSSAETPAAPTPAH
ncbi:hypothetical protein ACFQJD_16935 [Haloplanus sp. GCM10025708]|uniref:hypothetical protein n=1 Tax=Haloplanus sp. GCM10025708 TaxID=3252679 RepID=UPI0036239928